MKVTIIKALGTNKKNGFSYHLGKDRYVYQQYPVDRDYWVNGHNLKGKWNGWFCSYVAWQRTMKDIVRSEG